MNGMRVQCYEGDYDRPLFYARMGRFFAEEQYIRSMPYLRNKSEKVWFTVERDGLVVAFSSIEFPGDYILFTTEWVEPRYRRKGLFAMLTNVRFAYCRRLDLPIKTSTNLSFIKDYYLRHQFTLYRTTKHYWFLIRHQETPHE